MVFFVNHIHVKADDPRAAAEWAEAAAVLEELRGKVYPELLPYSRPASSVSAVRARYDRIRAIAARVQA